MNQEELVEKIKKDKEHLSYMIDKMLNAENEFDMRRFYNTIKFNLDYNTDRYKEEEGWEGSQREIYLPEEIHKIKEHQNYMYKKGKDSKMIKVIDGTIYNVLNYEGAVGEPICKLSEINGANIRYCSGMDY